MTSKYSTTLLAIATLVFSGCSGSSFNPVNPPTVKAAAPYPGGCPNSNGKFGSMLESPGSNIALLDTACALLGVPQPIETDTQTLDSCGKDQVVSLVTVRDIHVHSIRLWIGAGFGSKFETGSCLEIITAGIITKTFHKEWDKHIEEHASDQPFSVDFVIPAGSTVRLSRDPHSVISCLDGVNAQGVADGKTQGQCATQEMAELFGD